MNGTHLETSDPYASVVADVLGGGDTQPASLGDDPGATLDREAAKFGLKRNAEKRNVARDKRRNSYHLYSGESGARDYNGPPDKLKAFTLHLRDTYGPELSELFHDPVGGWKHGESIGAIGGHRTHTHVAWGDRGRSDPYKTVISDILAKNGQDSGQKSADPYASVVIDALGAQTGQDKSETGKPKPPAYRPELASDRLSPQIGGLPEGVASVSGLPQGSVAPPGPPVATPQGGEDVFSTLVQMLGLGHGQEGEIQPQALADPGPFVPPQLERPPDKPQVAAGFEGAGLAPGQQAPPQTASERRAAQRPAKAAQPSESVSIALGKGKYGTLPTEEELGQKVAKQLGFTPEEYADFQKERGHGLYRGSKEDIQNLVKLQDAKGQALIPEADAGSIASAKSWLEDRRKAKADEAPIPELSSEGSPTSLKDLRELGDDEKGMVLANLAAQRDIKPEEYEALQPKMGAASMEERFSIKAGKGLIDVGSGLQQALGNVVTAVGQGSDWLGNLGHADHKGLLNKLGQLLQQAGGATVKDAREIDRQYGLPKGTAKDLLQTAGRVVPALFTPGGSVGFGIEAGVEAKGEGHSIVGSAVRGALAGVGARLLAEVPGVATKAVQAIIDRFTEGELTALTLSERGAIDMAEQAGEITAEEASLLRSINPKMERPSTIIKPGATEREITKAPKGLGKAEGELPADAQQPTQAEIDAKSLGQGKQKFRTIDEAELGEVGPKSLGSGPQTPQAFQEVQDLRRFAQELVEAQKASQTAPGLRTIQMVDATGGTVTRTVQATPLESDLDFWDEVIAANARRTRTPGDLLQEVGAAAERRGLVKEIAEATGETPPKLSTVVGKLQELFQGAAEKLGITQPAKVSDFTRAAVRLIRSERTPKEERNDAAKERQVAKSSEPEYKRTPPRPAVSADKGEVREAEGERPSRSDRAGGETAVKPQEAVTKTWEERIKSGETPKQIIESGISSDVKPVLLGAKPLGSIHAAESPGGLTELEGELDGVRKAAKLEGKQVYIDRFDDVDAGGKSLGVYVYDRDQVQGILVKHGVKLVPHEFVRQIAKEEITGEPIRSAMNEAFGQRVTPTPAKHVTEGAIVSETPARVQGVQGAISRIQGERRKAEAEAATDKLTGLQSQSQWLAAKPRIEAEPSLHIGRLDVNGLKATNDRFGHEAGDRLISDTAKIIAEEAANAGIPARLVFRSGRGDEFSIAGAKPAVEKAVQAIKQRVGLEVNLPDGTKGSIAAGVGGRENVADRLMYRDKGSGKKAEERTAKRARITERIAQRKAAQQTQIKSATGNRGTFDPTSPNILQEIKPQQQGWLWDAIRDEFNLPKPTAQAKEPWQMTQGEYFNTRPVGDVDADIESVDPEAAKWYQEHPRGTKAEVRSKSIHEKLVRRALSEGKPVPAEALVDYPQLGQAARPVTKKQIGSWKSANQPAVDALTDIVKSLGATNPATRVNQIVSDLLAKNPTAKPPPEPELLRLATATFQEPPGTKSASYKPAPGIISPEWLAALEAALDSMGEAERLAAAKRLDQQGELMAREGERIAKNCAETGGRYTIR